MEAQRPSAAAEASPTAAGTLPLTRASLRDGILLMSLGLASLALCVGIMAYANSIQTLEVEGFVTLGALLACAWLVLSGLGAWKVSSAYARGLRSISLWGFMTLAGLYALGLPAIALYLFATIRNMQDRGILAALCLLPAGWLLRSMLNRERPWPAARAEPCWLLLGIFALGLSFLVDNFPIYEMHARLMRDLFEGQYLSLAILVLGYGCWIFGLCKAWRLRAKATGTSEPGWLRTLTQASWFLSAAVLAESLILLETPRFSAPGDFATALALPIALWCAWLCWPSRETQSTLKRRLVRATAALSILVLLPINAAFYGAFSWPYAQRYIDARPGWILHLPESVRVPLGRFWSSVFVKDGDERMMLLGLAPLSDLEQAAYSQTDLYASVGWYKLDPEGAMRNALAVTEKTTPGNAHEFAGLMLGRHGSDEQVRSRLRAEFSAELQTNLIHSLLNFKRRGFSAEVRDLFERRILEGSTVSGWGHTWQYLYFDSPGMREKIEGEFEKPDTLMPKRVRDILVGTYFHDHSGQKIFRVALRSPSPEVRIEALRTMLDCLWLDPDLEVLVEFMKWELPGATPEERRLAAELMARELNLDLGNALRPSNTPEGLDEMEEEAIALLLKAARARLDQTARQK
ncbi:MAG: hypothetical protein HS116_02475 [Planctomycetes bacterium]|nr:hypothetical protein [Planctomycetota bacterium]